MDKVIVLQGTVDDALKMYNMVDADTQKQLFTAIKGAMGTDQSIRVQARNQEHADELVRLSRLASAPIGTVTVRSVSRPSVYHSVHFMGGVPIACSCESFSYSKVTPCRHMVDSVMRGIRPRETSTE